jgi:xanthine dehydrogenase iron-sulfur cluster and FAD-binding subunit A
VQAVCGNGSVFATPGGVGGELTAVRARPGQMLETAPLVHEAHRVLGEEIRPIDDVRSTADYRLRVARNLLARFVAETTPDGGAPSS